MRADGETSLFLGAQSNYTIDPSFYYPKKDTLPALMPCFRLMDDEGVAVPGATLPEIDKETCVKMITTMVSVNEFDKVYNDAQRQGRLSFYFTNRGMLEPRTRRPQAGPLRTRLRLASDRRGGGGGGHGGGAQVHRLDLAAVPRAGRELLARHHVRGRGQPVLLQPSAVAKVTAALLPPQPTALASWCWLSGQPPPNRRTRRRARWEGPMGGCGVARPVRPKSLSPQPPARAARGGSTLPQGRPATTSCARASRLRLL